MGTGNWELGNHECQLAKGELLTPETTGPATLDLCLYLTKVRKELGSYESRVTIVIQGTLRYVS